MIDLNTPRINHAVYAWVYWGLVAIAAALAVWGWTFGSVAWTLSGLFCLAIGIYSGFIEPQIITVKEFSESLVENAETKLRVVFLSDLHAGPFKGEAFYRRVAQMTNKLKPDIVVMGGDAVDEETERYVDRLSPLATIEAKIGKYFLLGNHDYIDNPQLVADRFRSWGFEPLENCSVVLDVGATHASPLQVVGLSDAWYNKPDLALLRRRQKGMPRLLVLHEPDNLFDVKAGDADLVLMGHTHGGQVRLPLIGIVRRLPQNAPQWLDRGRRLWDDIPVIIGQGLGEADARVRLFCPPQIVVVDLVI